MSKQYEFGDPQREELAWAAGFFDGEGTTAACDTRNCRQIVMAVSQAGDYAPALLERFRAAVGVGKIYRLNTKPPRKIAYAWRVANVAGVNKAISVLWPWLGPAKRDQAARALKLYAESPRRAQMTKERAIKMANQRWNYAQAI